MLEQHKHCKPGSANCSPYIDDTPTEVNKLAGIRIAALDTINTHESGREKKFFIAPLSHLHELHTLCTSKYQFHSLIGKQT